VFAQKIEQPLGLAAAGAEVDIGKKDRAYFQLNKFMP
jgi:hypothetical protein